MSKIRDFINRTFHDEVIGVLPPQEVYYTYRDVGTRLESYVVKVTYKYAGAKEAFFDIDNDHFQIISKEQAKIWANAFYKRMLQRIDARNNKTR